MEREPSIVLGVLLLGAAEGGGGCVGVGGSPSASPTSSVRVSLCRAEFRGTWVETSRTEVLAPTSLRDLKTQLQALDQVCM